MNKFKTIIINGKSCLVAAAATSLVSVGATAADYTATIATASAEGSANVTAVILAVIGIGVLGFGVRSLIGWFNK